jgi:hypothetical protein
MTWDWGELYEIANVISTYLQKAVAEMSNKEREAGVVVTDFSKFSEAQFKKVVKLLGKSQGSFLYKESLIKCRKDTFGSNYMDHAKCGYDEEEDPVQVHEQCDLSYLIKGNRQFIMSSTPKDPSSQKQLPSCKVCLMAPWSRRFSKTRLLVTRNNREPMSGLSLPSLS